MTDQHPTTTTEPTPTIDTPPVDPTVCPNCGGWCWITAFDGRNAYSITCPTCSGSDRAWVHDAAGGYGTSCKSCDGTGTR
jgi:DnaJ-class molecular chaperone